MFDDELVYSGLIEMHDLEALSLAQD